MPTDDYTYLLRKAKKILGAEYIRFTYSEIMRNVLQKSKSDQRKWLEDYFELRLTKELLDDANPEGRIAVKMADTLRSKNPSRVFALARLVRFVHDHMH